MKRFVTAIVTWGTTLAGMTMAAPVTAQTDAAPDYTQDTNWLCRPGRTDACTANKDVTVIRADGKRKVERFRAHCRVFAPLHR